jgi:hypothetical protein
MATEYTFHKHFEYGLLREVANRLQYDMWDPNTRTWHAIELNPFTASMSLVSPARAQELAGDGDLYAENVEPAAVS